MGFKAWIETGGHELKLVGIDWNWWAWIETGGHELKLVGIDWNWWAWCKTGGLELKLVGFKAWNETFSCQDLKWNWCMMGAKTWNETGGCQDLKWKWWAWIETGGFQGSNWNWWSQVNKNIYVPHATYRCWPCFKGELILTLQQKPFFLSFFLPIFLSSFFLPPHSFIIWIQIHGRKMFQF